MPQLQTTYSTVEWSADGSTVTKTRLAAPDARRRFRNELRVNQMLLGQPAPVRTPALMAYNRRERSLSFESVLGEPVGPKYPQQVPRPHLDGMIEIAEHVDRYAPRRRWLRRVDSARRLRLAHRWGLLSSPQLAELTATASRVHARHVFAHGDLTARNVIAGPSGLTLIDWEWAGLYPDGYELAFLWFSLVDVEGARTRVEQCVRVDEAAFLLSALLIQLWHLQWYAPKAMLHKHLATRDHLVARLGLDPE